MKSIQKIRSLVLLAMLAAGAASCSKEELPATSGDAPQGTQLSINVVDGGYASGDPKTRTTENGYVTQFTAGDQIGLYVVKPGGTYAAQNVCLTLTDAGNGTLVWQAPSGTKLYYEGATAKYFAYYPYQQNVNGTLDPTATTAAGFFVDVVSAWIPTTDQSTHTLYTASDLMVGNGSIGSKQSDGTVSLSFTMTHAMALVVIELPKTKYKLTDKDNNPLPDYYLPAPDSKFYGFTPYSTSVGTYRYIVKPSQSGAADLTGSYTGSNGYTKEYTLPQNNIAAANYACYKVDGGSATVTQKSHTLQVGDFYLKDGSLLGKDEKPTSAQQAACIGVVLKVGRDANGNWKDDCRYFQKDGSTPMSTIHGYVLGLYDPSQGRTEKWGSNENDKQVDHPDMNRELNTGFYGYKNTNAIKAFAAEKGWNLATVFPATRLATTVYEIRYPAPAGSSGWFLPSAGQCQYWMNNKELLLTSVRKANGSPFYEWKDFYWSSSENGNNAMVVSSENAKMLLSSKNYGHYFRSVFAF